MSKSALRTLFKKKSKVTIDRYLHSVCSSDERDNYNKERRPRKKDWFSKNLRGKRIMKQLISYAYETKKQKQKVVFVTITTQQHKNGYTDKQCFDALHKWLKNRSDVEYINVCERQKNGDLHFHLFVLCDKYFKIPLEVGKLSRLFNVEYSTNMFNVRRVQGVGKVANYMRKYVTKGSEEDKFFCRTFSISQRLRRRYYEQSAKHRIQLPISVILDYQHLFVHKFTNEFCTIYEFSKDIWVLASKLNAERERQIKILDKQLNLN